jgi:hypothetical protein
MTEDGHRHDDLAWRNLIADWHLRQRSPLPCGCDDDTEDGDFCADSVSWADEEYAARTDPDLVGPPDPWDHDIWVASWGRNAPLIIGDDDFRVPAAPDGMGWLLTRLLVGGIQAVELSLFRFAEDRLVPPVAVARGRVFAEPSTVAARARRMLQDIRP